LVKERLKIGCIKERKCNVPSRPSENGSKIPKPEEVWGRQRRREQGPRDRGNLRHVKKGEAAQLKEGLRTLRKNCGKKIARGGGHATTKCCGISI